MLPEVHMNCIQQTALQTHNSAKLEEKYKPNTSILLYFNLVLSIYPYYYYYHHHHHHLPPPWIRSFDLFRHRRIVIVCWGVHGLFFLDVCS